MQCRHLVSRVYLLPISAHHGERGYLYLPVDDKGKIGGKGQPLEKGDHTASIHQQEILVIPPIAYRTQTAPRCGCDRIERSAGQIDFAAFVLTSQVKAKETQYFVELFDVAISQTFLSR